MPTLGAIGDARCSWNDWSPVACRAGASLQFERLPFDHPLYIMYSSGTTGLPKCMVHGAGGTLLQHLKELVLHTDLTRDDRMFYFTTCGWMMWNWLVSALAVGRDGRAVRRRAAAPHAADSVGHGRRTSASRCSARARSGSRSPRRRASSRARRTISRALRAILSTGSPLRRAQLRLRLRAREARRAPEQHQRRHGHHLLLRARQSDRARSSAASCRRAGSA